MPVCIGDQAKLQLCAPREAGGKLVPPAGGTAGGYMASHWAPVAARMQDRVCAAQQELTGKPPNHPAASIELYSKVDIWLVCKAARLPAEDLVSTAQQVDLIA